MAHCTAPDVSNFILESNTTVSNKFKMKKCLLHIINQLFRFLLGYLFPGKEKESNRIGKRRVALCKAAFVPGKSRAIVISFAPGEKTLWRHSVFRGGISASINL
jgi:hypothetical protein